MSNSPVVMRVAVGSILDGPFWDERVRVETLRENGAGAAAPSTAVCFGLVGREH